jgi:hypothetical protein
MSDFDLLQLLEESKKDFGCKRGRGEKWKDSFYLIEIKQRFDFFVFFLTRLKEFKPKEYLNAGIKKAIVRECIPKGKKYEDTTTGWYPATMANLNGAIAEVFSNPVSEEIIEARKTSDAAIKKVTDPEDPNYDWDNAPIWNPKDYRDKTGATPIEHEVDEEMAELLGYNKKK